MGVVIFMNPLFFKRLGAYLFDFIVVTLIIAIVTMRFNNNNDTMNQMNELLVKYANNEISVEESSNEMFELNYNYQKSIIPTTIANIVMSFGYFVVFACLNKGQTLGKKIFKIKIVNSEGKTPSIWNMLGRSIFLYGILVGIINIICLYLLNVKMFNYVSNSVSYIYYGYIIVCMFMIMYRKDNRGIHDMIGKTSVIGKVK